MNGSLAVELLAVLMPVLYAVLVLLYGLAFFGTYPAVERVKARVLFAVIVAHLAYLALRTAVFDHPPITSLFEIMSVLAVSIAIGYAYIEVRTRTGTTGFFILLLALAFQTASSLFVKDSPQIPVYLHSYVLGFHVSAALLGYTAISLSAVYGLLYLLLYREMKSTRFGVIYARLPNLEMLETMSDNAVVFGFIALTVAIVIGILWLPRVFQEYSYWDPKLIVTIGIWLLYAAGLAAKKILGWQGRKTMIIALVAFGFVFLSMTVINLCLSSFHRFH